MAFVNTAMLWGMLAGLLPIIIHLLMRQKYKRTIWAAMEFLMAAIKRTQRRLKIEHLILLLIRILVLVILALVLTRPFFESGAISVDDRKDGVHKILVIDNSVSMSYMKDGKKIFDIAKEAAKNILKDIDPSSRCTLMFTNDIVDKVVSDKRDQVLTILKDENKTVVSDGSTNFVKVVSQLEKELAGISTPVKEIWFITDLQKSGWLNEQENPLEDSMVTTLKNISTDEKTAFYVVNVGGEEFANKDTGDEAIFTRDNIYISEVTPLTTIITKGISTNITTQVVNHSNTDKEVELKLYVDTKQKDNRKVTIKANERKWVNFRYKFPVSGPHYVTIQADPDKLSKDDSRSTAIDVSEHIKVLIIDGDGKSSIHFAAALAPEFNPLEFDWERMQNQLTGQKRISHFLPIRKMEDEYNSSESILHDNYDLVVLSNVSKINQDRIEQLETYVKNGGSLMIYLGKDVNAEEYNGRLWTDANGIEGKGLLPMKLKIKEEKGEYDETNFTVGRTPSTQRYDDEGNLVPVIPYNIKSDVFSHPAIRLLNTINKESMDSSLIYTYAKVESAKGSDFQEAHANWKQKSEELKALKERKKRGVKLSEEDEALIVNHELFLKERLKADNERVKEIEGKLLASLELFSEDEEAVGNARDRFKGTDEDFEEYKYIQIRAGKISADEVDLVRVFCRYSTNDPMYIEKEYGDGHVVLCTTSCDNSWNTIPQHPIYVPIVHEISNYFIRKEASRNLKVGDTISRYFSERVATNGKLKIPGNREATLNLSKIPGRDQTWAIQYPISEKSNVPFGENVTNGIRTAGQYTFITNEGEQNEDKSHFSVNIEPEEGKLVYINKKKLENKYEGFKFKYGTDSQVNTLIKEGKSGIEIWRWLLVLLLALVCLESFLAMLFGQRSVASEQMTGVSQTKYQK